MRLLTAAALVVGCWAAAEETEDIAALDALARDEQCDSEGEDCSLNAIQLRGQKMTEQASAPGSCTTYKCGGRYHSHQTCQCNDKCADFGNCCSDFESVCKAEAAPAPSHEAVHAHHHGHHGHHHSSHSGSQHIFGHPTAGKEYPTYDGFSLMLVEEFNSPIDLDRDEIWTWSDGGLTEGQVRFQKENIVFQDGKMKVKVSSTPAQAQACSMAEVGFIDAKKLSSGEMRTKHNMFRYGRYEASWKAPEVQPGNPSIDGNYVSTLFVFRDAKYKHWREIDFEITGDSSVTTNVLSADNTDKWSKQIQESREVHTANPRADFHTYAFEWLPDSITWYIDGRKVREKRGGSVPVPDMSGKIMMNLWVFGDNWGFGGKEGYNNRYPMEAEYDWFRFYKWDGDQHYPCADMSSSCLTSDDMYLSANNPCDGIPNTGTVYGRAACHTTCHR